MTIRNCKKPVRILGEPQAVNDGKFKFRTMFRVSGALLDKVSDDYAEIVETLVDYSKSHLTAEQTVADILEIVRRKNLEDLAHPITLVLKR